jgi:hypothetical protein
MDKVQITDRSNTAPSSKTLRDKPIKQLSLLNTFYTEAENVLVICLRKPVPDKQEANI